MGRWSEALHPRGPGGKFASVGGVLRGTNDRSDVVADIAVGRRSSSAFHPGRSAAVARARKERIRSAVEVPRGIRPPRNWSERQQLEWSSPKKIAMQRALTGNALMPRREAIRRAASLARTYKTPLVGTKKTFAGKKRAVRGYSDAARGTQPTTVGWRYIAKATD